MLVNIKIQFKEFIKSILYCFNLSWKVSKLYLVIRLLGKIIIPINVIIMSILLKEIINQLAGYKLNSESENINIIYLVIIISILRLSNTILNGFIEYISEIQQRILEKYISINIIDISTHADIELYDNKDYYNKIISAQRDFNAITIILWNSVDCLSNFISLFFILIMFIRYNIWYGIIMLISCIPSAISRQRYTKLLYRLDLSQIKTDRQKQYIVQLATTKLYAQSIRLYNIGGLLKNKYLSYWKQNFLERKKLLKNRTIISSLLQLLPEIVIMFISINIIYKIIKGIGTLGDYSLYTGLLIQLWSCIVSIVFSLNKLYEDQLKINNLKTFNKIPEKVKDIGKDKINEIETIEFINVTFKYPNTNINIINNMSFKINKYDKVSIIGINGSGKSTLIKLLLRLYEIDNGKILINNKNITEYTLESLRKCFSLYFQEEPNYSFSLRENIIMSDINIKNNDKFILSAIHNSNSDSILDNAIYGLDTYITKIFDEDGIELSGGENQKIALARTLYRDTSVVILDEPSSSLDPESEHKIFKTFNNLFGRKTVLCISHRLSTISFTNKIMVIEKGQVIEYGTKEELLKSSKRFATLYKYYTNEE